MSGLLVDTHAHLSGEEFEGDRDAVVRRAQEAGVEAIIDVGTDLQSSVSAGGFAERQPAVFASAGIHPHEASKASAGDLERIESLLDSPKTVAVGEIGLDYHYSFSPHDAQKTVFQRQIEIGLRKKKPLIVHVREAMPDALAVLRSADAAPYRGVFHCYGGTLGEAEEVLALGFHISFTGVVTFRNYAGMDIVRSVPAGRLLLETDAPYMTPVPLRGRRNEPAFIMNTLQRIADMRGETAESVAASTTRNARALFGLG
ncbi:MAG: TatD family hydrolase [bacterium]|nr:TatD family hydrolase [bacterium]